MGHEDYNREQAVDGSSNKAFGITFAVVFGLIAIWPLLHGGTPLWWSIGVAVVFAAIALAKPALLAPLNRQWMKLGILLGAIVAPIALAVLFYGVFTPIGAVMRLAGKDPLRLKREPHSPSYWLRRQPPGPAPDSLDQQF